MMQLYWGDLHNHCGITYGFGSLENALTAAGTQLDFCSVTPHAMWPDMPARSPQTEFLIDFHVKGFEKIRRNWDEVKRVIGQAGQKGGLVTFYSFEIHSSRYGDYHIVSPDEAFELIYGKSVFDIIKKERCRAIAIPHHIAYTPGYRGIQWDSFDSAISPVVEVCSKHGCAMSDHAPFPYYHDMGPRDGSNTVYEGLRRGFTFGFIGSTDHHAGYPGSYGDGKLAVLAGEKTREGIWEALLARRAYAVTGDRIRCRFTLNGEPFGACLSPCAKRNMEFDIECGGALDKAVIYKNLRPIHVVNGEFLPDAADRGRYKIRLELGWGDNRDTPYHWDCLIQTSGGAVRDLETCFRGKSILSPNEGKSGGSNVNALQNAARLENGEAVVQCDTFCNVSTLHPQTSSVLLTVEGTSNTALTFLINGRRVTATVAQLLRGSLTGQMEAFNSQAYKIHAAVPEGKYHFRGSLSDEGKREDRDFYHLEVRQENGHMAFVSPIYIG